MQKEQKVISLPLAKKIQEVAKKKGIKLPESEWWWCKYEGGWTISNNGVELEGLIGQWSAYDTSELGEMLPRKIKRGDYLFWLNSEKESGDFIVQYICWVSLGEKNDFGRQEAVVEFWKFFEAQTEAEAKGKMYFYLLENDLI